MKGMAGGLDFKELRVNLEALAGMYRVKLSKIEEILMLLKELEEDEFSDIAETAVQFEQILSRRKQQ